MFMFLSPRPGFLPVDLVVSLLLSLLRSMETPDVKDHENRIKASFEHLAIDFVAKQVADGHATNTDVVSVMLMHDGVDVLFERYIHTFIHTYNIHTYIHTYSATYFYRPFNS